MCYALRPCGGAAKGDHLLQPKSRPQAVVLDVGNVLLDWNPAYLYEKLIPSAEERTWFLTHVVTLGWHVAQDRGRSCADGVADLTKRFPGSAALIAAFYDRWLETIYSSLSSPPA